MYTTKSSLVTSKGGDKMDREIPAVLFCNEQCTDLLKAMRQYFADRADDPFDPDTEWLCGELGINSDKLVELLEDLRMALRCSN